MSIEARAVQVAAVAALLVEDCQRAASPRGAAPQSLSKGKWWDPAEMVLAMVRDERKRRIEKSGDRRRLPVEWLMTLALEVGSLVEAVEKASPPEGPAREACENLHRAADSARRWLEEQGSSDPRGQQPRAD